MFGAVLVLSSEQRHHQLKYLFSQPWLTPSRTPPSAPPRHPCHTVVAHDATFGPCNAARERGSCDYLGLS